jgi:DNA polymerase III sliding clamp (beta) subunit (PCNA family)
MPVFQCRTNEAFQLKVLADLLSGSLKVGCFVISEDGFTLCQADNFNNTLIDLSLDAGDFCPYVLKTRSKIFLGLNMTHLHKMLKMVKKKDSLQLTIHNLDSEDLELETIPPKDGARITTSFVKILRQQCVDTEVPSGYGRPVIVQSGDLHKMIKDLQSIGPKIRVVAREFYIRFECDSGGGVLKRHVTFGDPKYSKYSSDDEDDSEKPEEYCQEFSTEQFTRIAKVASLSQQMKIYFSTDLPLKLVSSIGSMGEIRIFIKSLAQISEEQESQDGDD